MSIRSIAHENNKYVKLVQYLTIEILNIENIFLGNISIQGMINENSTIKILFTLWAVFVRQCR